MNNQLSQNHWGVPLLFLMICSATFVTCEGFIDARGFFSLVLFFTAFSCTLYSSGLHAVPQNCPTISFVLCILYISYTSHILPYAIVSGIFISLLLHIVYQFLKAGFMFCSSLILLSRNWCLLLKSYLINHWPKLGFGIEKILEIIQPVWLYLPTCDHWDLQSLNAMPKVIYPGGSLTFFLALIPEHLSLQFFAHRTDNIGCCPEVGTNMKILENRWRHTCGRSMTPWLVESDSDVRTCTDNDVHVTSKYWASPKHALLTHISGALFMLLVQQNCSYGPLSMSLCTPRD